MLLEGEKYACAELMVDEIKSAGGIMPKVSQTLAMKPDVVKAPWCSEPFGGGGRLRPRRPEIHADGEHRQGRGGGEGLHRGSTDAREATWTEAEKLRGAIERDERTNFENVISSIEDAVDVGATLVPWQHRLFELLNEATGSVAQVLKARVKPTAPQQVKELCSGQAF